MFGQQQAGCLTMASHVAPMSWASAHESLHLKRCNLLTGPANLIPSAIPDRGLGPPPIRTPRCPGLPRLHSRPPLRHTAGVAMAAADERSAVLSKADVSGTSSTQSGLAALLALASSEPRLPESARTYDNRVAGCLAQVWLTVNVNDDGLMQFEADSDSAITRALAALLARALSGRPPEEVLQFTPSSALELGNFSRWLDLDKVRLHGLTNMLRHMQKRTRLLVDTATASSSLRPFPSLLIGAGGRLEPQGDFAVMQAKYLRPDTAAVAELQGLLAEKKIGVVAHFYMDPEVQGALVAARDWAGGWPHVFVADSLAMADAAVKMAEAGCERIVVLGVDFMAENARAVLQRAGYGHVPVMRLAEERIGCSLADAAAGPEYEEFLGRAAKGTAPLHVIYINTSLETKAKAAAMVPTITCTSSNVVSTILQAAVQVPDVSIWYGPDTYMGRNLVELLRQVSGRADAEVAALHPGHTAESVAALVPRIHMFEDGQCIVHDLFGQDVVERVRTLYSDAFIAAHFEVPGDMFTLALAAAAERNAGVVGSTSNILDFIRERTREALARGYGQKLQFVLGTEAGMVTAIVAEVQALLDTQRQTGMGAGRGAEEEVEVEIVFPVASDAISAGTGPAALGSVLPGAASGEGCSISGGCATCPYMKMNSLTALFHICRRVGGAGEALLEGFKARGPAEQNLARGGAGGVDLERGVEPILHMRHYQRTGVLPDDLMAEVRGRPSLAVG